MPRPFRLLRLDHVVLRVRDTAAMQAFYRDVLGCTVERRQEAIGLVQLRAGDSLIDLVAGDAAHGAQDGEPAQARGRNLDHLCLRIEPFDPVAIAAHLDAHGLAMEAPRMRYGAEGEGPSLYLDDPEGNTVELKGPPVEPGP